MEDREAGLLVEAGLYRFFSQLFAAPPPPWLLQDLVTHCLLTTACHFHETSTNPHPLEDPGWASVGEELAVEFTALFSAPGEHYLPPYESFYVDELHLEQSEEAGCGTAFAGGTRKGFIGQQSASAVCTLYARAGLELNPAFHDLPDHLAAELAFLAHLADCQASALQQGHSELAAHCARQAEQFRHSHLDRWCPAFLARVQANPISRFYCQVAVGLEGFLAGSTASRPRPTAVAELGSGQEGDGQVVRK